MNILNAGKNFFVKGFDWDTRISRSEFWYGFLVSQILIYLAYYPVVFILIVMSDANEFFSYLWMFLPVLPVSTLVARRLHDINRTGWWFLINAIPIVGGVILIFWCCKKGDTGKNLYGQDPLPANS